MSITYIILAIVVALVLFFVVKYNGFITLKTRAQEAWAD
ncbi:MAG: LemA family protein, partial [Candidatus Pacebacteria bacterium]|nr:LemA family protein [Candidatus Paceibacterota bacterium]